MHLQQVIILKNKTNKFYKSMGGCLLYKPTSDIKTIRKIKPILIYKEDNFV